MIYSGNALDVTINPNGIAQICFDLKGESVNKLNNLTRHELKEVIRLVTNGIVDKKVKGVLVYSGKPMFIVGADITEFKASFDQLESEFVNDLQTVNSSIFNALEELAVPTVACLNGMALGGGFELAMAMDFRIMSTECKIGLPETSLGILPGYGGTVRLPRIIGLEKAIDWIISAKHFNAERASQDGAVDLVTEPDKLITAALDILQQCIDGKLDYKTKRNNKLLPIEINADASEAFFSNARGLVEKKFAKHYPAPMKAIDLLEKAAKLSRNDAIALEIKANAQLSKTIEAKNLIGIFMGDQALTKSAKVRAKGAQSVKKSAVLGAGIMGGGIAYQSALKGIPIIMKDISQTGIDLGLAEADGLLSKQVSRGKMSPVQKNRVTASIEPSLNFEGFDEVDFVVEAVVENIDVKHSVLAEVESHVSETAVLTSNTSTISINNLANALTHPERFCGMHFFNPVPVMPLVEVIRGDKTSDDTIGRVCSYALAMGKKPVVVNDCPGFLINRILSPYFNALIALVRHGVEYQRIDRVMEAFGWPMGPAHLIDVIGIDTLQHGDIVLAAGYPDRMKKDFVTCTSLLNEAGRLGQKNGAGFYTYSKDKQGRLTKSVDVAAIDLLSEHVVDPIELSDEEISLLMMLPMCFEAVRCLQDNIVSSPVEIDMSLIYAIGFPQFRGGALRYLEAIGFESAVKTAEKFQSLGGLYSVPVLLNEKMDRRETFYR